MHLFTLFVVYIGRSTIAIVPRATALVKRSVATGAYPAT